MSTRPAAPTRAAARATPGLARRGGANDPAARLERLSDRLDALIRDVRLGPAFSHREYERRCNEAEAIADRLRAAFREPTAAAAPQINPPLWQQGGKAIW